MKRVLIIEDDLSIAELERDYLELSGFSTEIATDGEKGLERFFSQPWDLVVLDLMLPRKDGMEICRQITKTNDTPILVVSAKNSDADKIKALGLGIDDYMTKPFSPSELTARVKAHIYRYEKLRGGQEACRILCKDGLTIDLDKKTVFRGSETIALTATEYFILEFLASRPGRVVSRDEIFLKLRGEGYYGDVSTITVHIRRLREKIESDPSSPKIVETVWGMGYRFCV